MNRGLFEPTVMFFGMCNSPATFQAMMDNIFGDMINDCIVIIYMDDIFLFAPDKKTLTENTKKVLTSLRDNDLFLKLTNCEFNQTKVEYLGLVIEEGRISMDPGNLKGIRDWPTPTTVNEGKAQATEASENIMFYCLSLSNIFRFLFFHFFSTKLFFTTRLWELQ